MSGTGRLICDYVTLSQWMTRHGDDLNFVVTAFCDIFQFKEPSPVQCFIEEEIEQQARLLLLIDSPNTILAIAGWNWAHLPLPAKELPVYLGIRLGYEEISEFLLETLLAHLRIERKNSGHHSITTALLQFRPAEKSLAAAARERGFRPSSRRNEVFTVALGGRGHLRSMIAPID